MANIKVTVDYTILNGQPLTFKSPADCSQVTGLVVCYPEGDATTSKSFQFADAHGNNVGDIDLFAENVLVKVILDTEANRAYVQNADTNAYLEGRFKDIEDTIANKKGATTYTAIIGTSWTTDEDTGVSVQTVAIDGVTADHTAKVDHSNASVDGTSDGYALFVEEENQYLTYITNGYAETYDGGITFYIFGDAPTISIPIVVEVV